LCTEPQKQLWSYRVNLDKRVRSDHPLRKLNDLLKLDFVRQEVAKFYGIKGHVSEDPAVIMKMMLLLFLDDVRSERELMRIIPERLDYMWFLGYGLDDTIPDHSILSKARKRWGQEVFVSLFSQVVAQCVSAGLVDGSKIHVDSSLVDANASLGRSESWTLPPLIKSNEPVSNKQRSSTKPTPRAIAMTIKSRIFPDQVLVRR
jgi:transposase